MTASRRGPPYILVLGDPQALRSEEGAASQLARLGAQVERADLFASFDALDAEPPCRALVVEAGDRPDIAAMTIRRARRESALASIPILVAVPERQVARLEPSAGFDDFIVAPYFAAELYARVRLLEWRRSEFASEERVKMGELVLDIAAHEVSVGGRNVALTSREFALLVFLVQGRGRVFSRDALLARVWGARYDGGARTVDIHVRRLRAKLGDALPLETIRGSGYKLRTPAEGPAPIASPDVDERDAPTPAPAVARARPKLRRAK